MQQALGTYMVLKHAHQLIPQPTQLLPELKNEPLLLPQPSTPLLPMHDERQTHEHFGIAFSEAQSLSVKADHTTASTPHK